MLTNAGSARRHEPELTDDDVKQLCEEFRGLYTLDDVNSFLDKKGLELSSKDWTRVLQRLIETDASRWLLVISEKLKDLASEEAALISTLVPFARAIGSKGTPEIIRENLKTIGLADPRLGLRLHLRISQTGEPLLIDWSGSLMSGYLIESPPEALKWLSQEFDKSTGPSAVALLRAVGSLKGSGVAKSYPEVFDLLRKATERERELQLAAIDAYFNLADSNPEESAKQLLDLSRKNDDEVKFGIARNLMVKQFPDPELEWGIIRVL